MRSGGGLNLLVSFMLAGLLLSSVCALGAARGGKELYQELCARCHGPNGEGVNGKYEKPLQGDWSLAKVTRIIDKTMPEDDPDLCRGQDAEAVARYIYDAFYSKEARARLAKPRVELARLTNRQYLNTVADLVAGLSGDSSTPPGGQPGLRGSYFAARGFNPNKRVEERIDRDLKFDFTVTPPLPKAMATGQVSIQWRGSVLPDETGDYVFVLKSPNGARLWVNGEDEPLIDAWVASGEMTEHRGTIRLLGGRAYPIQVDWFRDKETNASLSLEWVPPHGAQIPIPPRSLRTASAKPVFVVKAPFPADDSSAGYERGVGVTRDWDQATTQAALEVAQHVVSNLDRLSGSKADDPERSARSRALCERLAGMAFRRPLTDSQRQDLAANFLKSTNLDEAVRRTVLRVLKSPYFLFPTLGYSSDADDFAVASRLATALWDSVPDNELLMLARQKKLQVRDLVAVQAKRMVNDPRAKAKMQDFLRQWLDLERVEDLSKDTDVFPGFSPELMAYLRTSLNVFLEEVVWNGTGDYRELLLADYLFLNAPLAGYYQTVTNGGSEFVPVQINPEQRSGVLTHPYLLAAFSYRKSTSPIHRGVFLTRKIMGRGLKPPPVAVAFKDAEFDPKLTMREKVTELTRPQACQTCHSVINPLGFSLEHFNAVGKLQTEEKGRKISVQGDFSLDDGKAVTLRGPRDVAKLALADANAQRGFIEQLFHYTAKQPVLAYGPDTLERLRTAFLTSNYNLRDLLVEVAIVAAQPEIPDARKDS